MIDIFATLGPACASDETLKQMLEAGMTGLRLNLNHGRLPECMPLITEARAAARFFGTELKIVCDLQGRSLRIGVLPEPLILKTGDTVRLGKGGIPVPEALLRLSEAPEAFSLSDGRIRLRTLTYGPDTCLCLVTEGGVLESRKGIAVPGYESELPPLTAEDLSALDHMREAGVYAVMVPFVTERAQLVSVRRELEKRGCGHIKIWAKLENRQGLKQLPDWLPEADMCVIARGDLGNAYPPETVPALQKHIASLCRSARKPFLVATGLLSSLMRQTSPARADLSDIYNAVLDGAAALMLTDETARGAYPVRAVQYLTRTVNTAGQTADTLFY